ncbi:hypothetical protein TrLO_g8799 [Triparma laevis f. longispina]|uniref:HTH myb-type domain-containing protein n=1 Tax=Triparma laevis f. longispina TaxID=1714387 RepID=A0A9W7AQY5_9STRA|nr:hypothetical protein TrLO_g8799 [Triparma laevis f. longispina]
MEANPRYNVWTSEETATLLEGVEKYRLDFERIMAESGDRLGKRKASSLYRYLYKHHPDKVRELRKGTPKWNGTGFPWTAEEDAALLEGVEKHGLDFEIIQAESGDRLGKRSAIAIAAHLHIYYHDKHRELRAATPRSSATWTAEEKAALFEGVEKHELDFERIKAESGGRLDKRSASALKQHLYIHRPDEYKEFKRNDKQIVKP